MDLEIFFKEKDIPYKLFEIEFMLKIHFIDTIDIIKLILKTQGDERKKNNRNFINFGF